MTKKLKKQKIHKYINKENKIQEVLETSNIQGVKIIREGSNLKIENIIILVAKFKFIKICYS